MIFAILGTLMYAIANTLNKYVSMNFELYKSLFFQYIFVSLFGFLLVTFFDSYRFDLLGHIPLFIMIGVSGFLGIWALMKGMKYLSSGVVFIIANLYVIGGYFINNYFPPDIESFSYVKIVLGILFFIIISILLFEKDGEKGFKFNNKIYFPLLAALGWTIYTSLTNYVIKKGILTSFQGMFYSELLITMIVIAVFLLTSVYKKKFDFSINKKQLMFNIVVSFLMFLGALGIFTSYSYIAGNYVNVICLVQIPALSVLYSIKFGFRFLFLFKKVCFTCNKGLQPLVGINQFLGKPIFIEYIFFLLERSSEQIRDYYNCMSFWRTTGIFNSLIDYV